jgi:hypothetical protein
MRLGMEIEIWIRYLVSLFSSICDEVVCGILQCMCVEPEKKPKSRTASASHLLESRICLSPLPATIYNTACSLVQN